MRSVCADKLFCLECFYSKPCNYLILSMCSVTKVFLLLFYILIKLLIAQQQMVNTLQTNQHNRTRTSSEPKQKLELIFVLKEYECPQFRLVLRNNRYRSLDGLVSFLLSVSIFLIFNNIPSEGTDVSTIHSPFHHLYQAEVLASHLLLLIG